MSTSDRCNLAIRQDLFPEDTGLLSADALVFCASVSHEENTKAVLRLTLARPLRCLLLLGIVNLYCWGLSFSKWPASQWTWTLQAKPKQRHTVLNTLGTESPPQHQLDAQRERQNTSNLALLYPKLSGNRRTEPRATFTTKLKPNQNLSCFEFLHERLDQLRMCSTGVREEMNLTLKGQFHIHWNHTQKSQGRSLNFETLLEKQLLQFSVTLVNHL